MLDLPLKIKKKKAPSTIINFLVFRYKPLTVGPSKVLKEINSFTIFN